MTADGQATAATNPLERLHDYGQAVWLDFLARRFIAEGGLKKLIEQYAFGVVKAAQARGDFEVLAERDRRILRIHVGAHVAAGLTSLKDAVRQALT
jgi:hypothetical protein